MNPYEILSVPMDATADQIKSAYRRLAAVHHPDKGGDVAKFQDIAKAYDILSNPISRERFDTTGETEKDDFSKSFQRFFNEILVKHLEAMPDHDDPIRVFKKVIKDMRNQLIDAKAKTGSKKRKLEKVLKRLVKKNKNKSGILEFSIEVQINACGQLLAKIDGEIKFADDAYEVIDNYNFQSEPEEKKQGFLHGSAHQQQQRKSFWDQV